jgi:hypothetical protein
MLPCRKGKEAARDAIQDTDDSNAQETADKLLDDSGGVRNKDATDRMIPMVPGRIIYMQPAEAQGVPLPSGPTAVLPEAHANDSQLRKEKKALEAQQREKAEQRKKAKVLSLACVCVCV